MDHEKTPRQKTSGVVYIVARVIALLGVCSMFFSAFNPSYVFTVVGGNSIINSTSVFTGAVSSDSILTSTIRAAIDKGVIDGGPFFMLRLACILLVVGLIAAGAAGCVTVGNVKMKHLGNKIFMLAGAVTIAGAALILVFYNGVENMVHEKSHEGSAYSVSFSQQTDAKTFTLDGKTLTKDNIPDEIVYQIVIKNETGKNMEGWAVELTVDEGYDVKNVLKVNKWASIISRVEPELKYNVAVEGDKLIITPDNYFLKDGELVQEGESVTPESALIPAGEIKLTFIAENISLDTDIVVTDGSSAVQNEWQLPWAVYLYLVIGIIMLLVGVVNDFVVEKTPEGTKYEMETKYTLFIMFIPFLLLIFAFSYLPLYGWRYAFFEENTTFKSSEFVGFYWFKELFGSEAFRTRFLVVMRNTLVMSGLGLLTSWLPMAFAIFLNEIKSTKFRRFVQTFSTIPNFISWVLVYAIAFSIFAADGLINNLLGTRIMFLNDPSFLWVKMLLWGTWKGIGWSAIIYISGIAGIDQQLYEAASIDGADRFQRMWHITLPGLMPTYVVMLVMSIAGILSNGMDQYLVFSNALTREPLEVLDLYTYNLGINSGQVALSTVVGMGKSVISIILFFVANTAAKKIRGNGIV